MPQIWTARTPKTLADVRAVQAQSWGRAGSEPGFWNDISKAGATSGRLCFGQRAQGGWVC